MLKKKSLPALLVFASLAGVAIDVHADISANVALVSDYRFRGISQSNEDFAIQGGFDYAFENGFYVGTWGSSVDFDSNVDFDGSLELDIYGGWSTDVGENSSIDVGYIYYAYPGDTGAEGNYQEIYFNYGWKDLSLGIVYSDDYYGSSGSFWYLQANYDWSFAENWVISLHAGYNDLEEDIFLSSDNKGSYIDYSVGVSWSVAGVDLGLAWVGTDLNKEDVFGTSWGDDTAVFSLSKSF